MKTITIRGFLTKIDDDSYEEINKHKWYLWSSSKNVHKYAVRFDNGKAILMHRYILRAGSGCHVDHINGDGLDNRKENLRIATPQQNQANSAIRKDNKSGYKGVYFLRLKSRGKIYEYWHSRIMHNGRYVHLGVFNDKMEAVMAYNTKALELYGEYARVNKLED